MVAGSRSSKGTSFLGTRARAHQCKTREGHELTWAVSSVCALGLRFSKALLLNKNQHAIQASLQHLTGVTISDTQ